MTKLIKTVKELKEFLQSVPDDTAIAYFNEDERCYIQGMSVEVSEAEFADDSKQEALKIF